MAQISGCDKASGPGSGWEADGGAAEKQGWSLVLWWWPPRQGRRGRGSRVAPSIAAKASQSLKIKPGGQSLPVQPNPTNSDSTTRMILDQQPLDLMFV